MSTPLGVYRPGRSVLHRLPVGAKLLGLVAACTAVVVTHGTGAAGAALGGAVLLAVVARIPLLTTARSLRLLLLIAVVGAGFQWWSSGAGRAVETLLDVVTLGLLGLCLTVTTASGDMIEAFVRWLGPFRRLGVDPDRVALTISLTISALPETHALALETRDAARARGLRSPRAYLTPFVIRVVARAHETGAALQARGLGD
jgi:biotin transport system permease protein